MALTRIQIVDLALSQAGLDSSFQGTARLWLNVILEKKATHQNLLFYQKTADVPFVADQLAYTLPADFLRVDTQVYFLSQSGQQGNAIPVREKYTFSQYRTNGQGYPTVCYIDMEDGTIVFNSAPNQVNGSQFRMPYYRKPDQYSLDDTDDAVVVDNPDQWTLIQELVAMALEFRDDERYMQKKQEVKAADRDFQRNLDQAAGNAPVPLNNLVFHSTRRNWNRWGFGGGGT